MKKLSFILFVTLLISCGGKSDRKTDVNNPVDSSKTNQNDDKIVVDNQLNDLSLLLAGLPQKSYQADTGFSKKYVTGIQDEWSKLDSEFIQPILTWTKQNINHSLKGNKTCFYPFSGADFLYANAFFPDADNYILIGLEPAGSINDPSKMNDKDLADYLFSCNKAMFMSHDKGFYRTNSMKVDFSKKYLDGTVHNILFYVARRGYSISGIDYFELDTTTGKPIYTKAEFGAKNDKYGVKVRYIDGNIEKSIYYMQYDLWNPKLEKKQELFKFVDSFGGHYLFLKAASYLSQYPQYSLIHDYMMKSSTLVIQDDSGIPYKSFDSNWNVELWGNFKTVLRMFKNYDQPDLKEAYEKLTTKKKLPFQIGYNVSIGESNLQYCIRKSAMK